MTSNSGDESFATSSPLNSGLIPSQNIAIADRQVDGLDHRPAAELIDLDVQRAFQRLRRVRQLRGRDREIDPPRRIGEAVLQRLLLTGTDSSASVKV